MRKIAIIFPGLGYHPDKPLLYYGKKLAKEHGYQIVEINYGGFKYGVKDNPDRMREAFESALRQTDEILAAKDVHINNDDDVLFISKSIGTAVACAWQKKQGLKGRHIYFTPVEQTFLFTEKDSGIVFHGTADDWARTDVIREKCQIFNLPLFVTENANHSMETGHTVQDLEILQKIMIECEHFLG